MKSGGVPRAVLFDWDNTLVDNWAVVRSALNATLEAHGHAPWTVAETRRRVARSSADSFPALFGDRWEEAQAMFYERFAATHLDGLEPRGGAATLLHELGGANIYTGVVSNKRGDLVRTEAAALGWSGYFGRIVGAGDAAADKPALAAVDTALEGSAAQRGPSIWFVGDSAIDMECARNADCTAVLLDDGHFSRSEIDALQPDLTLSGCRDLAALVRDRIATI